MIKIKNSKQSDLQPRPPVVVVLGHVDHGKTSILDFIRKSHVAEKESGGITQHIGAYQIDRNGKKITFIDTPGHEAFSAMRSRGARVADIAILVVAAEEGVKPQTKEAIWHIQKSHLPFVVAINKIDKPEANPEKVKGELAKNNILVESMGGKVPSVGISTKNGKGIEELLELILLLAEMEELKGDFAKPAQGLIIEAYLDSQRGPTVTLLLRDGTLKPGDIVGTASNFGKIKILEDFQGKSLDTALPSMPCVVIGFEGAPQVGEKFEVYPDFESAKQYIAKKEKKGGGGQVFVAQEGQKILNLIIKADVQGSLEAVKEVLRALPQEKVILRILKSEVGDINETDVKLAKSGQARIFAFRIKSDTTARALTERENIHIHAFDIIYELAQGARQIMEKMMVTEKAPTILGKVKVLAIFLQEKNRQILGGKVVDGEIRKGSQIEIFRNEELLGRGKLINLQKNKKDVDKAIKGEECGLLYGGDIKIEQGDVIQAYAP